MRVQSVERIDEQAVLDLEGGGRIALPAGRIVNWDELAQGAVREAPQAPKPGPVKASRDTAWLSTAGEFGELIASAARRHELDPALLMSVARVESALDPRAVSPKGACGLLQLMPATAERFGVHDVFDPSQNVEGGARYLSWLLDRFDGSTELALAGYNAGEGAVERHKGIPPYRETRRYVKLVLKGAAELASYSP